MRIGLFFGSFNPPHVGHTIIASWIREAMTADEVWMVVSPQNPFKDQKDLLDEKKRMELVLLSTKGLLGIEASDIEFDLSRPSYTVDTMKVLKEKHPQHDFFLIMGSDNILQIKKWKEWQSLLDNFEIAVYPRKSYKVTKSFKQALPDNVHFVKCPIIDLSSTVVRKRIAKGKSYQALVRKAVSDAIASEKLYR